jgi:hypothetical protein
MLNFNIYQAVLLLINRSSFNITFSKNYGHSKVRINYYYVNKYDQCDDGSVHVQYVALK